MQHRHRPAPVSQHRHRSAPTWALRVQLGRGVKIVAILRALCTATASGTPSQSALQRLLLDVAALPGYDEYSWMWGDAGEHLLGHPVAELDVLRWSEWKSSAATIRDLEACRGTKSFNRPVEIVGVKGIGHHVGLLPLFLDSTGSKMSFVSPSEAIRYLKMHRKDYSWMWGDAGTSLLGHGIAEIDPFRWSVWESADSMIEELAGQNRALNRPVEIKKDGEGTMMFQNVEQAIVYLKREKTAGQFSASLPTIVPAPRLSSVLEGAAAERSPPSTGPTVSLGPSSMDAGPTRDAADSSVHLTGATAHLLLAILAAALVASCGGVGCLCIGKRCMEKRRGLEVADREGSQGEALTAGQHEDDESQKVLPDGLGELRRLLEEVEEDEPIRALPSSPAHSGPDRREEAAREVERILATRDLAEIFGKGTAAQQKSEYRRLVRMLHPDKGLVSGERATLALRRVVEYHSVAIAVR